MHIIPKELRISLVFSPPHIRSYLCPKKARYERFSFIPPTSVVTIPGAYASAAFTTKTSEVFKEEHNIETDKEGGDWATDIVEAINMICFTMRVHSNLVGSVPGKLQTNNSGSDSATARPYPYT